VAAEASVSESSPEKEMFRTLSAPVTVQWELTSYEYVGV